MNKLNREEGTDVGAVCNKHPSTSDSKRDDVCLIDSLSYEDLERENRKIHYYYDRYFEQRF